MRVHFVQHKQVDGRAGERSRLGGVEDGSPGDPRGQGVKARLVEGRDTLLHAVLVHGKILGGKSPHRFPSAVDHRGIEQHQARRDAECRDRRRLLSKKGKCRCKQGDKPDWAKGRHRRKSAEQATKR